MPYATSNEQNTEVLRQRTRARLYEIWLASRAREPLEEEDRRLGEVLLAHREFHPVWDRIPFLGEREFTVRGCNPFAHVSFHIVLEGQLALGDPPEAVEALEALMAAGMERHEASHLLLQVLVPGMYRVLKGTADFDLSTYRARLKYLTRISGDKEGWAIWLHRPGRNDPCPCGSSRKFKRCCGEGGTWPPDYFSLAANLKHRRRSPRTFLESEGEASQKHALMILDTGRYLAFPLPETLSQDDPLIFLENSAWVADALREAADLEGALAAFRRNVDFAETLNEEELLENACQDLLFFCQESPGFEEEGIEVARRLAELSKSPKAAALYRLDIAFFHERRGESAEAETIYRGVLAESPDHPWALLRWARFLRDNGRPGEAESAYRAVLALRVTDDDVVAAQGDASKELDEMLRRD